MIVAIHSTRPWDETYLSEANTGHQAFFTEEAVQQIAEVTIENLDRLEAGEPAGTEVTSDFVG
jgi:lactate dehydrogenase-like 2-hydroxyacid dehydrogenase